MKIRLFKTNKELEVKSNHMIRKQVPPLINYPVSSSVKKKTLRAINKF